MNRRDFGLALAGVPIVAALPVESDEARLARYAEQKVAEWAAELATWGHLRLANSVTGEVSAETLREMVAPGLERAFRWLKDERQSPGLVRSEFFQGRLWRAQGERLEWEPYGPLDFLFLCPASGHIERLKCDGDALRIDCERGTALLTGWDWRDYRVTWLERRG